jgi:hypothetical protein
MCVLLQQLASTRVCLCMSTQRCAAYLAPVATLVLALGAWLLVVTDTVGAAKAGGAADAALAAVLNVALEVLGREQAAGMSRWQAAGQQAALGVEGRKSQAELVGPTCTHANSHQPAQGCGSD